MRKIAGHGILIGKFEPEDDDEGIVFGILRLTEERGFGFYWLPSVFTHPAVAPMSDEVREEIVRVLRFHADKLERKEVDERMKRVLPHGSATA